MLPLLGYIARISSPRPFTEATPAELTAVDATRGLTSYYKSTLKVSRTEKENDEKRNSKHMLFYICFDQHFDFSVRDTFKVLLLGD